MGNLRLKCWQCWVELNLNVGNVQMFFLFICLFFRAMGQIGAAATGLHHGHISTGSELCLQPTDSSTPTLHPPDPLNEAKAQTHILTDTSGIRFHCATMETPVGFILENESLFSWVLGSYHLAVCLQDLLVCGERKHWSLFFKGTPSSRQHLNLIPSPSPQLHSNTLGIRASTQEFWEDTNIQY